MSNDRAPYNTDPTQTVEHLIASQRVDVQDLISSAENLVAQAKVVRQNDAGLVRAFVDQQVKPWRDACHETHQALHDLVMTRLPDLRAVVELVHANEAKLAVATHGSLLRQIRVLDDKLETLRHSSPPGIARVSMEITALVPQRPSGEAEELLTQLLPPTASEIASETILDVKSRLVLEDVPEEIRRGGAGHVRIWRDPAIELALKQATKVPI